MDAPLSRGAALAARRALFSFLAGPAIGGAATFAFVPAANAQPSAVPPVVVQDENGEETVDAPRAAATELPAPPIAAGDLPMLPETQVVGERAPAAAPSTALSSGPEAVGPMAGSGSEAPERFPAEPLTRGELVSPGGVPIDAARTGTSVTVITEEQIRQSRFPTVIDILRHAPGVNVVQSGGPGRAASVFIRGANSEHTKVLLDGIPLNDASNPTRAFDFGNLAVDNIERIEILKGPQSAGFGSDAIGGVINIITKRGSGPASGRVVAQGGYFGTHREAVTVSGGNERFYYSFGGSYYGTDGFSQVDGGTEADGFGLGTLSGRCGWNLGNDLNLDYVMRYIDGDTEIDDFGVDNPIRRNLSKQFFQRLQLQHNGLGGAFIQRVGFDVADQDRQDTDPGAFGVPLFHGRTQTVDYTFEAELLPENTLVGGVDYAHEEAFSTFDPTARQFDTGIFLEDRFAWGERLFFTAAVRRDEHSVAGSATTYRVTSAYLAPEVGGRLHASAGTGFRAPSLAQSLFTFSPGLRPEFSKGWDVGYETTFADGIAVWDVTYFNNRFRDLIVYDFNTNANINLANSQAHGVETSLFVQLTDVWSATGNYTYTDSLDLDNNEILPRRPRHQTSVTLQRPWLDNRLDTSFTTLYVSERLDFPTAFGGLYLKDYIVCYANANYRMSERTSLFGRIDNVFGENYQEAGGFATAGFSIFGGAEMRF
ncbi:MAG TPA: TonB-dependent receptor [Pirellulaceae bacterium]|jgi:vitamin B12 transporter|nr:TonB-dependent receptor [Pirellulaceae bacterium]